MEHLPSYFEGFWIFIFGLIIGSFLNVVIHRVPRRESIVLPDSHCPECNVRIRPYDNIPVLSYLILGGRCRSCGVRISPIYPAVELLVAALYLLVFFKDGLTVRLIVDVIFVSLIVPLVFIDLNHKLLPNAITYPGLVVVLILRLIAPETFIISTTRNLFHLETWPVWWVGLLGSGLGAIAGGGTLWLIREFYYRFRHKEGMGLGDVKMMLMVGAFLGWQLALMTIFIASLAGSLIGILAIWLRGGTMKTELQFGVFLGAASIIALFTGEELIRRYASLYR